MNFSGGAARVTTPPFGLWRTSGSEFYFVAGKIGSRIRMRFTPRHCSNMGLQCPHCWRNLWKTPEWIVKFDVDIQPQMSPREGTNILGSEKVPGYALAVVRCPLDLANWLTGRMTKSDGSFGHLASGSVGQWVNYITHSTTVHFTFDNRGSSFEPS